MNTIRVALELGRSLSCGERCNNGTKEKTVATHNLRLTKVVKKNRDKRQSGFEEWYVWKTVLPIAAQGVVVVVDWLWCIVSSIVLTAHALLGRSAVKM